ncbi:MAG: thioredoxin family protein [Chitinophagales bacterium]|nr:thioredoxin family protein [Chitinophagales bacterium]
MNYVLDLKDIDYTKNICLYFYANWLPYNKNINKIITSFELKNKNIIFYAIDVDTFKTITKSLEIKSVPTFVFFSKNKEIDRFVGNTLSKGFNSFCINFLKKVEEEKNGKK